MTYDDVIGMEVGKYFRHACILDTDGTQVLSKHMNQNEKPCAQSSQCAAQTTTSSLSS